jgi:hypothetical protein
MRLLVSGYEVAPRRFCSSDESSLIPGPVISVDDGCIPSADGH